MNVETLWALQGLRRLRPPLPGAQPGHLLVGCGWARPDTRNPLAESAPDGEASPVSVGSPLRRLQDLGPL